MTPLRARMIEDMKLAGLAARPTQSARVERSIYDALSQAGIEMVIGPVKHDAEDL